MAREPQPPRRPHRRARGDGPPPRSRAHGRDHRAHDARGPHGRPAAPVPYPRPTALVAFNDKTAAGAIRAAREAGLTVPGDLSVTGFDDSELGQSITPALTTVRQPLEEMGRMAVSLLVRLVAGHAVDTLHVELATPLVVRDSTAPPPACRV
ncbi:LacI family DNA-binding transcriptional regulator [Streptomyces sp. SA3_actF]|uniref:LacI family DNA-binding transcriptional regulator n=1 Tax=Streptomyces sp. SA3_actF TaxID=682181 RepID=UPI003B63AC28